jgi:hypothetical protein
MRRSIEKLADLKGDISTFGSGVNKDEPSNSAFLFADENRLYLRAPLRRYAFLPEQAVTIEENSDRGIVIKHNRLDYLTKIVFNSSVSATEMISTVASKGFLPSASVSDISIESLYYKSTIEQRSILSVRKTSHDDGH